MTEIKMVDDRNKRKNRIPLSPRIRYKVLRRDGFTCQYCGRTADERELEIDHIVPYSKGGTNDLGNLQVACKECNRGKSDLEVIPIENHSLVSKKSVQIAPKVFVKSNMDNSVVKTTYEFTDIVKLAARARADELIKQIDSGQITYDEAIFGLRNERALRAGAG